MGWCDIILGNNNKIWCVRDRSCWSEVWLKNEAERHYGTHSPFRNNHPKNPQLRVQSKRCAFRRLRIQQSLSPRTALLNHQEYEYNSQASLQSLLVIVNTSTRQVHWTEWNETCLLVVTTTLNPFHFFCSFLHSKRITSI